MTFGCNYSSLGPDSYATEYSLSTLGADPLADVIRELYPLLLGKRNEYLAAGGSHPAAVLAELREPLITRIFEKLGRKLNGLGQIPDPGCTDPDCLCQRLRFFVLSARDLASAAGSTKLPPLDKRAIRSRLWRGPDHGLFPLLVITRDTKAYLELGLNP